MPPDLASELVAVAATATIYAVVGLVALAAGSRVAGRDRAATLLLAWAMLQHALNEVTRATFARALGFDSGALRWLNVATGYFIAVPWAFLFERMLGRGRLQSLRLTAFAFVISAVSCVAFDLSVGRPGAAAAVNRVVVAVGACVAFAHLFLMTPQEAAPMRVMRIGILVFMGLVVHDTLARAGLLPWNYESGVWAVLVCVGAIGYTVVSDTMRRRSDLRAVEQELATARRIQASLLPTAAPALDGATVAFRYLPATAVAGDVFDFVAVGRRQLGILVADVSGHGVPAALIASMVKVAAAAQKPHAEDPARVLAGIHLALAGELPPGHFVTAVYAFLDLEARRLRFASAGHPPPVLRRADGRFVTGNAPTGPLIISFAPAVYPATDVALEPGDRLLFYTDGVTEASGSGDEMFGVERVEAVMSGESPGAEALVERLLDAVASFARRRGEGLDDDCTMVAVQLNHVGNPFSGSQKRNSVL